MQVKGDLIVKRGMIAEVRADRGLEVQTVTGATIFDLNAYSWNRITNNTADEDVTLPDATTLFGSATTAGWSIVVQNDVSSTFNLDVKDAGAGLLKTLVPGTAYEFTCTDNTAAAGVWYVTELGDTSVIAAARYKQDFSAAIGVGGWTAGVGVDTITITGATHTRGLNPSVFVSEVAGAVETKVDLDISYDNTTGDVTLSIPDTPAMTFAGRVVII